ncbi:hypothetical protein A3G55_02260 [Candidatus Giovannonibacteria bacterium RIFCSPLOWO2_12_FULL_44_25]|uniref:PRELI/MSF1 domain-containing protein n=3 Tax=Candidatus Giovannoniibacteriota TaxID=1752738 RepID=A0A0G1IFF6_9BACT|nr:MAG: hypothetical protein UW15_C0001G0033 [Parcubacteria group bacterium GW2011_GWC1_44_10]KKT57553.1 MAG: hypothetical protein UW49_C0003G0032 [Candidatus Giovannonibacteria bacterium GW2011_GWB1_44_23]KKT59814.1 MAG: hypothetical protein UW53_C0007G0032 [Candidatus Giovannonibacteria bacterium GW2011_GWA1_44_25]OGF49545.1 MAG: hypothetical protein A2120_01050 [Candidatus Giovannonibacteria bacterium GWA2_45_15]OGF60045.1 MAG: hypothetical protein A2W40_00595 [Candidatus Giovannonibacteria 
MENTVNPTEHDVKFGYHGCTSLWVVYHCFTCNEELDSQMHSSAYLFGEGWEDIKGTFLRRHPCPIMQEIKIPRLL